MKSWLKAIGVTLVIFAVAAVLITGITVFGHTGAIVVFAIATLIFCVRMVLVVKRSLSEGDK